MTPHFDAPTPKPDEVRAELANICSSGAFSRASRLLDVLRRLVEKKLAGRPDSEFKEVVIGLEIRPDYVAKERTDVKVAAGRLRKTLAYYYDTEGKNALVRIQLMPGSYIPAFHYNQALLARYVLNNRAALYVSNARAAFDKRTLRSHEIAFRHLDLALLESPGHPRILALKAWGHANRGLFGLHPRAELEAAEAITKAIDSEPFEPWELFVARACVRMALYWDWTGAQALFDRAIDRSFGEAAYSSTWYTSLLAVTGRIGEAIEIRSREVAHSPQDVGPRVDLALLQIIAAHYREAEDTLRLSLDEPARREHYQLYMLLAILHGAEGDFQAAVRAINKVPMATSESTITMGLRPLYDGLAGHRDRAAMEYKRMVSMRRSSFVPASQIAFAAIGASDYEAAVSWLTEAVVNERDPFLVLIGLLPFLAPLHAHAGFRALVTETMNLTLTLRS